MSQCRIWLVLVRSALPLLGVSVLLTTPAVVHAGVVAVCADGSITFAKKWSDVNCAGPAAREDSVVPTHTDRRRQALTNDTSSWPSPRARPSLTLPSDERRDLALLVDLSQRDTPAIVGYTNDGYTTAVLQIAHSRAFEAKLRARQRAAANFPSGPILVYSLEPANADLVATRLSFSQGGRGYRPGTGDPRELGWIDDEDARTRSGSRRLGYIILPKFFELSRPLVVFWGDAVVAATLRR
jgi:hypothetical protein